MSVVTLGIIGCGRVTQQLHLPALRSVPAIRITAVADINPAHAEKVGDLARAKIFRTGEELIDDSKVEAVAICTPPDAHCDLTLHALVAGKHVLVEKPLAMSVDEARRMQAAADAAGTVAVVGFNLRFHRFIQRARELIEAGELGNVRQIITTWSTPNSPSPIGVTLDIGVHHLDACPFLLQENVIGGTITVAESKSLSSSAMLVVRTSKNTLISSSFSYSNSAVNDFRIIGTKASLCFSLYDATSFALSCLGRSEHGPGAQLRKMFAPFRVASRLPALCAGGEYALSYRRQWQALADAIRGKRTNLATFKDGVAPIKILHDANRDDN